MKYITLFILALLFWLLLTLKFSLANLIAGITAAGLCTAFFGRFFIKNVSRILEPSRYFWFIVYLIVFTWACIKANLDVAYRVLHPKMPIRPGIVKVKTELKSDLGKMLLANSITMTPGTISVDIIDSDLYIHWIFIRSEDPAVYTGMITGSFEKYIKRIIE